jgi:hypothetical protein
VSALSTECYFWLSGNYSSESLPYLLIIIAEIVIFGIAGKLAAGRGKAGMAKETGKTAAA